MLYNNFCKHMPARKTYTLDPELTRVLRRSTIEHQQQIQQQPEEGGQAEGYYGLLMYLGSTATIVKTLILK